MSKATTAEPNGTTAVQDDDNDTDTPEDRPVTNDGIYGLCNELEWDGVPAVHRRKVRDLLVRITDPNSQQFPVTFTKVSVSLNQFGDTVVTLRYDEGSITDYDLEAVGIDLDRDSIQAWHDRTGIYLHTDD